MASLVQLRQDLQFNARLGMLLEVLRSIATQQFQVLERAFRTNTRFFEAIATIAATLDLEHFQHPYTQPEGPIGVIAVTSDTGLLGGLNHQVIATAVQEYQDNPGELIVVGKRGVSYARERGVPCREFPGVQDVGRRVLALQIRDYALGQVRELRLGALSIVYPRAHSFTVQRAELVRAIPCQELVRGGTPPRIHGGTVMLESSRGHLLEYLVWLWVGEKLFEVFGLSRIAEMAARAVHLEGSSQELQRRGHKLKQQYFRKRHEIIDSNMRELFAARSLYGQS
jgi:F0F1-type ATP synthase gamma subunit